MVAVEPRMMSYDEIRQNLEEIEDRSADYSWLWKALAKKKIFRQRPFHETFEKLRQDVDPDRPYFFGEMSNGIKFAGDARDFPSALHAVYPNTNQALIQASIDALSNQGGDVVDIGANIGVVSASISRHIEGRGRLHAIEASPSTLKIAAATLAINGLSNFTLTFSAVAADDRNVQFHTTPGNSAISSLTRHGFQFLNDWKAVEVPGRRLDTLAEVIGWDDLALIKIDVEGHEMDVIRGARETISTKKPVVVFEFTPAAADAFGLKEADFVSLLSGYAGFDFVALVEPSLFATDLPLQHVSFPLPEGLNDQVNVFATPRSRSMS